MAKLKRQFVVDRDDQLCLDGIDGFSLDDLTKYFLHKQEEYAYDISQGRLVNFYVDNWGHDGGKDFYLRVIRPETDIELKKRQDLEDKRVQTAEKQRKDKEEHERKEYERLKLKFEAN